MRRVSFLLLLLFVFTIPLEDTVQFEFGRISKVLGIVAFAAWILTAAARGRVKRPAPAIWAATALLAWAAASYFWSTDPAATLSKLVTLAQMLGALWIIWDQVDTAESARRAMQSFLLSSLVAAAVTIANVQSGEAARGTARFAVDNAGPNNAGCLLAIAVAIAWHLSTVERTRSGTLLYLLAIPPLALGVFLTASRTALIALAVGVVVMALDRRNLVFKRLAPITLTAVLAATIVVLVLPDETADRLGTTGTEITSGTLNQRTTTWRVAYELFSDRPVLGVGAGAFGEASSQIDAQERVAHNVFVSVAVELGTVGVFLLVLTLGLAGRQLWEAPRSIRRSWASVCAIWFGSASALTWETRKITWFVLALTLVQPLVGRGAQRLTQGRDPVPARVPTLAGASAPTRDAPLL